MKNSKKSRLSVSKRLNVLKQQAYKEHLESIQADMPSSHKTMSRWFHHWIVEQLTDAGANAIFRGSYILIGTLAALVGFTISDSIASKYGFSLNFFLPVVLFILGFVISWLISTLVRLIKLLLNSH